MYLVQNYLIQSSCCSLIKLSFFYSTDINLIICPLSGSVLVYMRSVFDAIYYKMLGVTLAWTIYPLNMSNCLHSVILLKIYLIDENLENYSDTILNDNSVFPMPNLFWCPRVKIIICFISWAHSIQAVMTSWALGWRWLWNPMQAHHKRRLWFLSEHGGLSWGEDEEYKE